jgi:hypothetical protein
MPAFSPSKRVKFEGYGAAEEAFVLMEVSSANKIILRPAISRSEEGDVMLIEDAGDAVCAYLSMLDTKLPDLQTGMAKSKLEIAECVMGIELPGGGGYVNVWSGLG